MSHISVCPWTYLLSLNCLICQRKIMPGLPPSFGCCRIIVVTANLWRELIYCYTVYCIHIVTYYTNITCISSFNPKNSSMKLVLLFSLHFTEVETEAQRSFRICPMSPSRQVAEVRFEPRKAGSRIHAPNLFVIGHDWEHWRHFKCFLNGWWHPHSC